MRNGDVRSRITDCIRITCTQWSSVVSDPGRPLPPDSPGRNSPLLAPARRVRRGRRAPGCKCLTGCLDSRPGPRLYWKEASDCVDRFEWEGIVTPGARAAGKSPNTPSSRWSRGCPNEWSVLPVEGSTITGSPTALPLPPALVPAVPPAPAPPAPNRPAGSSAWRRKPAATPSRRPIRSRRASRKGKSWTTPPSESASWRKSCPETRSKSSSPPANACWSIEGSGVTAIEYRFRHSHGTISGAVVPGPPSFDIR